MSIFSDESILLIKNWEVVKDILTAERRLRNELSDFLDSIEADLNSNEWWQDGWVFRKQSASEVYISKRAWQVKGEYVVLIGVEGFVPGSIFGFESQSALYIYVAGKRYDLARKLAELITEEEGEKLGDVEHKTSSPYVIRPAVRQCLPEETEEFAEITRNQIIHFFTHYAPILAKFDKTIQEFLATG